MADKNLKILVAGDVEGQYDALFNRVQTINKKSGPFDMLICVGDFFGSDSASESAFESYKVAEKRVPIPTFVLGPSKQDHLRYLKDLKGYEICQNLTLLGDYGVYTGSSGLKIVYVSGKEQQALKPNEPGFSLEAVKSIEIQIANSSSGVDILLTSQWPKGVENLAVQLEGNSSDKFGSALLARLAQNIKPRYHFAALEGMHYERLPYRNHEVLQEKSKHVTRYIALGKVGNTKKLKWLYAFNIAPMSSMATAKLNDEPAGTTPCPYDTVVEQQENAEARKEALGNQYFYDVSADVMSGNLRQQGTKRKHQDNRRPPRPPPKPMGPCWFCLSSPEVEKHLVVSVGEHCYVALAKGPLVPEHLLICPIGHYQSSIELPEEVLEEAEKFKTAISKAARTKNKSVVFFERNFKSPHLQIQCVALPTEKVGLLREIFFDVGAMKSVNLDELPSHASLRQAVPPGRPYFFLELPNENRERFVCTIQGFFPLQFGREVLADKELLNCAERVDWKKCPTSRDEEVKLVAKFRQLFQPFDFTL